MLLTDKQEQRPAMLSIAGFDPSGGAGLLADMKTAEQLQTRGMAIMTANTIQTEDTFFHIDWVDVKVVCMGIEALMQRYPIQVVKLGIVKDLAYLAAILQAVRAQRPDVFIIWDPVLKSSSGFTFFDTADCETLGRLLPAIDLLTPNADEYQTLAPALTDFPNALLLKGGHREKERGVDTLLQPGTCIDFPPGAGAIYPKHGSGCVLSAAIAAYLAQGKKLAEACRKAKAYTEQFLNSHPSLLGFHYDTK